MADPEQGGVPAAGVPVPLSQLPAKGRVLCRGRIESVTYFPADRTAAFTAIMSDAEPPRPGSTATAGRRARLRVVWLGRRRVPGIEAGTELRLEGMLSRSEGLPTIFNPRYEILSHQENE
ncbi:hypothetical protein ACU18_18800 [Arthrobacter sp. ZBG10]|uniref:OB-fold nucleic acid binding domain-containing protein n=1 Tax=Micrococcaceae TaxID=1268 RepID=UPI000682FAD1|nr:MULTISPECIES: OB-fold nucleic acid binding domain-containing protein [Micrococcaceae]KNH12127.1 hypothetical protein ACU18_18800 [Arthrobacter sp. ZBG10]KQR00130.1 hypothetical protein ASF72_16905 [Arthrobacter sp. Leaf141]